MYFFVANNLNLSTKMTIILRTDIFLDKLFYLGKCQFLLENVTITGLNRNKFMLLTNTFVFHMLALTVNLSNN